MRALAAALRDHSKTRFLPFVHPTSNPYHSALSLKLFPLISIMYPDSQATIVWTSVSKPTPALLQNLQSLALVSCDQAEKELPALYFGKSNTDHWWLIFPIGSMVLVYILTLGVYWWDPCYHIWQHHGSVMGSLIPSGLPLEISSSSSRGLRHPRLSSSSSVGSPRLHTSSCWRIWWWETDSPTPAKPVDIDCGWDVLDVYPCLHMGPHMSSYIVPLRKVCVNCFGTQIMSCLAPPEISWHFWHMVAFRTDLCNDLKQLIR